MFINRDVFTPTKNQQKKCSLDSKRISENLCARKAIIINI